MWCAFENVEVRGSVSGHWQEEGIGTIPTHCKSARSFQQRADLLCGCGYSARRSQRSRISCSLRNLSPGLTRSRCTLNESEGYVAERHPGPHHSEFEARISVSGYISSTRSKDPFKEKRCRWPGTGGLEALVAAGRPDARAAVRCPAP